MVGARSLRMRIGNMLPRCAEQAIGERQLDEQRVVDEQRIDGVDERLNGHVRARIGFRVWGQGYHGYHHGWRAGRGRRG